MLLMVAMVAGVLAFGGIAVGSAEIAKMLCVLFLVLSVVSLLGENWTRHPTP